jgi:hypothetical protein
MGEITITPESYRTSQISPLLLSEKQRVQMTFEGQQVDNLQDLKKNIKGKLIIKKKNKTISSFTEVEKFSKKDISSNELIEIALDTEETYNLAKGLFTYYRLLSGKTTNPFSEVTYIEKDDKIERLKELLGNEEDLLEAFSQIDLGSVNAALNIENLRRVKKQMEDNMQNDQEIGFWQGFFEKNAWILAQLFHSPVMLFQGKRYLGGKGINNHGGQYADFLYQNEITENVSIIEIKSPTKPLLGRDYRQVFTIGEEVSGGINQLLKQKSELLENYALLYTDAAKAGSPFNANNVECILVIGSVSSLPPEQKEVFDTYRNELRSVRIIGFDELLKRIENLLDLFEAH